MRVALRVQRTVVSTGRRERIIQVCDDGRVRRVVGTEGAMYCMSNFMLLRVAVDAPRTEIQVIYCVLHTVPSRLSLPYPHPRSQSHIGLAPPLLGEGTEVEGHVDRAASHSPAHIRQLAFRGPIPTEGLSGRMISKGKGLEWVYLIRFRCGRIVQAPNREKTLQGWVGPSGGV